MRYGAQRNAATENDIDGAIGARRWVSRIETGLTVGCARDDLVGEVQIRGLGRDRDSNWIADLSARLTGKVNDVVVNDDGRKYGVGAAFVLPIRHERCVNIYVPLDFVYAFCGNLLRHLAKDGERVAGQSRSLVRVVVVHKGECPIGLNSVREIRVATGYEDEVAFKRAVLVDRVRCDRCRCGSGNRRASPIPCLRSSSLVVDAGTNILSAFSEYKTSPVCRSRNSTPKLEWANSGRAMML